MNQNKQELPNEQHEEPDFSSVTVGVGGPLEREIKIKEFLSTQFGTTTITTAKLEGDEGFMLSVENTPESGKAPQQAMWLSKPSMVALMMNMSMFAEHCPGFETKTVLETMTESLAFRSSPTITQSIKAIHDNTEGFDVEIDNSGNSEI